MRKLKIGFIGCGHISQVYLENCTKVFDILDVVAVADMFPEMAQKRAEEFNIPKAYTVEEILADPEIELIVNLTSPTAHTEVNLKILEAGKHVYTEKPFALSMRDADRVLTLANSKNLRVGSAPDTFLGGQLQTARKIIDDGWIGTVYATSGMILSGNDWNAEHPNTPAFMDFGWDPLFDMAPYWLTAMVHFFGPAKRVAGSVGNVREELHVKTIQSPHYGKMIPVKAPMNVTALINFENGVTGQLLASKESNCYVPRMEVFGTKGSLYIPDPNSFGGTVKVRLLNGEEIDFPYSHGYVDNSRGLGVAEMASAIVTDRPHLASGELAKHILEISEGILNSSQSNQFVAMKFPCEQPKPLPFGKDFNQL